MELAGVFGDADGCEGIGANRGCTADAADGDVAGDPPVALSRQGGLTAACDFADVGKHECPGAGPERQKSSDAAGNVFQRSKDTQGNNAVSARPHRDGFLMNFLQQLIGF